MASSTTPDLFLVYNLVVEHVASTMLPVSKSYTLLRFRFLRADTCVLVLPHAAVSVVRMVQASVNRATRDLFPAALRADEVPYGCVIDATADQDIAWGVTEVARLAISGGRLGAFWSLR